VKLSARLVLERIEPLVKNGVIAESDFVDHFSYWLKLMDENASAQPTNFLITNAWLSGIMFALTNSTA
jgi:hypothetical protein